MKPAAVLFAFIPAVLAAPAVVPHGHVVLKVDDSQTQTSQQQEVPIDDVGRQIQTIFANNPNNGTIMATDVSLGEHSDDVQFTCNLSDEHFNAITPPLTIDNPSASVADPNGTPRNIIHASFFCSVNNQA